MEKKKISRLQAQTEKYDPREHAYILYTAHWNKASHMSRLDNRDLKKTSWLSLPVDTVDQSNTLRCYLRKLPIFNSLSRLIYLLYWLLEKILLFLFCSRRYYYFYCLLYYNNISVVYRVGRLFFCEIPPCYLPKREILIFFNINIIEFQLWASLYNDCFFINKQKY